VLFHFLCSVSSGQISSFPFSFLFSLPFLDPVAGEYSVFIFDLLVAQAFSFGFGFAARRCRRPASVDSVVGFTGPVSIWSSCVPQDFIFLPVKHAVFCLRDFSPGHVFVFVGRVPVGPLSLGVSSCCYPSAVGPCCLVASRFLPRLAPFGFGSRSKRHHRLGSGVCSRPRFSRDLC
jgi:hypothetical protein